MLQNLAFFFMPNKILNKFKSDIVYQKFVSESFSLILKNRFIDCKSLQFLKAWNLTL